MYRYLSQVRQELAVRLVARLYAGGSGTPSKVRGFLPFPFQDCFFLEKETLADGLRQWWLSFTKRKFMGKAL